VEPLAEVDALRRRLDAAQAEIERLRLTLDVVAAVDFDAAVLNRNGILESLDRARRWQARRGDVYGLLVVAFAAPLPSRDVALVRLVAATLAAGLRDVDEIGRIDDSTFGAVLGDIAPGSVDVVCRRIVGILATLTASEPAVGGPCRIAGIEVMNTGPSSGDVLETAVRLAADAYPGGYLVDGM